MLTVFAIAFGVCGFALGAEIIGTSGFTTAVMMPAFAGRSRAVYEYIQDQWGQAAVDAMNSGDLIATPSYLRVEQLLNNGTSQYKFNILSSPQDTPVESKLNQNDVFICTHLGMYIIQYVAVGSAVTKWTGVLQTYPNASELTGPTTPHDLNAFYNGFWSISVGRVKFFDRFPAHLCFKPAVTQQDSADNYSSFEWTDGAASIDPLAILSGAANNEITLNVPIGSAALAIQDQGTTSVTKVVFHPYGFLVNNAANFVNY